MSIFAKINARKALILHGKGKIQDAKVYYEKAIAKDLNYARYLLAYSVLLIREHEYEKAKSIILKAEKSKDLSEEQKKQIYVNYAICLFKLGDREKAIKVLEKQCSRSVNSLLYQTLGYLYLEAEEFDKAYSFINESLDYDPDDSIIVENMAQYYYRKPQQEKEKAKVYFNKALSLRPNQIDSLYFLALYDIENNDTSGAIVKLEKTLQGNFSPLNFATRETVTKLLESIKS